MTIVVYEDGPNMGDREQWDREPPHFIDVHAQRLVRTSPEPVFDYLTHRYARAWQQGDTYGYRLMGHPER